MKILMVCQNPLGQKSGAASRTVFVAKSLKEEGHSITLLSPSYQKYHEVLDIDVIYIPTGKIPYLWTFLWHFLSFFYIIFFCLIKKPLVIYLRVTHLSILQVIAAGILRVPCICEEHTIYEKEFMVMGRNVLIIAIALFFIRIIYQLSTKIIVITPNIGKSIIKNFGLPEDKIFTVSNGVDINLYKPKPPTEAKRQIGLDERYEYITFVGIFAPWQGLEFLLKAAPQILDKFSNVKILLVGDGMEKEKLENLAETLGIEDRIIFTGWIDNQKVSNFINCASICVAPFKDDRKMDLAPLKVFSYLACARPIVTTDVGGVKDLIEKTGAGMVVPQGNSDELAKAIIEILNNKELATNMGNRGRETIEKEYSWNIIARTMISIFKEATTS